MVLVVISTIQDGMDVMSVRTLLDYPLACIVYLLKFTLGQAVLQ